MSDIAIDSSDEIDSVYDLQPFEWNSNRIWNGREVYLLRAKEENREIFKAILSESIEKPSPLQTRDIEQLILDDQDIELENLLAENGYEFDMDSGESEDCKSFKAMVKSAVKGVGKAAKKASKAVEKCAKKVAEVGKKAVDEVFDFVTEHKKECIIGAAIVAAAAIAAATLGTGSGAGAALVGAAGGLANGKKEEDDDAPNPKGTDSESSGSPPDPNHNPVSHSVPDHKISEFSTPTFVPPSPVIKSPFANFLESFNRDKISPETFSQNPSLPAFNPKKDDHFFNHESDPLQTQAIPTEPQSTLSRFLETIRLGAEIIGRGMCEPELFDPNAPLDEFIKSNPDNSASNSIPQTGQTISTFFQTIGDTLAKGLEGLGRSLDNPFDLFSKADAEQQKSTMPVPQNTSLPAPTIIYHPNPFFNFAKASNGFPEALVFSETPPEFSRLYKTEGTSRDDNCITFINGIANTFEEALLNAEHIRKLMPSNLCINGIYNRSNTAPFDLAEVIFCNYWGFSPGTQDLLIQSWTQFHEKNKYNPFAKILHFCHSQGAIHTKNALMRLPKEIRDRIIIVAIAPAEVVPRELCYTSYNYVSEKDIVHYSESLLTHLIASFNDAPERQELLKNFFENRKQLILLKPHENATGIDHEIQNLTYVEKIKGHLRDYYIHDGQYQ